MHRRGPQVIDRRSKKEGIRILRLIDTKVKRCGCRFADWGNFLFFRTEKRMHQRCKEVVWAFFIHVVNYTAQPSHRSTREALQYTKGGETCGAEA